jgi:pyruvate dehydrogenase E2 component (dihydrolipoamide acetyltransferase)/2-oxoisovalerate dehydrogenase E2 component (dihydrolipoyl transacylase)
MDFKLPELGEGIYEAELIRWLVKPGDSVRRSQGLMEVMTDKATMEVPSPFTGIIDSLTAEEGNQLKVGQLILRYSVADRTSERDKRRVGGGEKIDPAVLRREESAIPAVDGKKQKVEAASALNGPREHSGIEAKKGVALLPKAAPSVRLMARKLGVDLEHLRGSGPDGRILIEDLASRLRSQSAEEVATAAPRSSPITPTQDFGKPGTRLKLHGLRRVMAEHMVKAKQTIPHATYVDECDVTELVHLRDTLRETFSKARIKLTYLPFFVKAVTAALKEIPIVNSSLEDSAGEVVLHDQYHVGVATATPGGLIVPVLHNVERMNLTEIARELGRLTADAKSGKSRLEDLRGGTFTITSIGGYGGLISTPVINHPQTAILGIGKIVKRPMYDSAGNVKPADLLYLSLSFDHRVLDGAVAAAFCNAVIRHLQSPAVLLLHDKLTD